MTTEKTRPRVLSGVQPSGDLHIGNFVGALGQWVEMLDDYDCFFCIVDLHALTSTRKATGSTVASRARDVAALYVACGIDPSRATIFVQSQVPEHSELMWLLTCSTPLGALQRMTQFKGKSGQTDSIEAGLLVYPVLQAADILLYDTEIVPVGDDQRQHIELTRDIAQKFNAVHGETFVLPRARVPLTGARIMGLDDPDKKMSKTDAVIHPNHSIGLLSSESVIRKRIARAVTDSGDYVEADSEALSAGVRNLVEILASFDHLSFDEALRRVAGESYGKLKETVADSIVSTTEPIRERYEALRADEAELDRILQDGAEKASEVARRTLLRAQTALGIR
ncbi:tryptophan--tRNA ligase [Luethyella okanaganae]|uniref:Tryptophan--tRNA ligase n=1 Tax=Luethyella okanaganae TaxID=69372 RepID=A0ABW1VC20_9MICO